jgi:hypothetical protein
VRFPYAQCEREDAGNLFAITQKKPSRATSQPRGSAKDASRILPFWMGFSVLESRGSLRKVPRIESRTRARGQDTSLMPGCALIATLVCTPRGQEKMCEWRRPAIGSD